MGWATLGVSVMCMSVFHCHYVCQHVGTCVHAYALACVWVCAHLCLCVRMCVCMCVVVHVGVCGGVGKKQGREFVSR